MVIKHELHEILDQLSEANLDVLLQVARGLQASAQQAPEAIATHQTSSPIRPKGFRSLAKRAPHEALPLAEEYSHAMQLEDCPENQTLLRKVMFTPLSELLSWVNQPQTTDADRKPV